MAAKIESLWIREKKNGPKQPKTGLNRRKEGLKRMRTQVICPCFTGHWDSPVVKKGRSHGNHGKHGKHRKVRLRRVVGGHADFTGSMVLGAGKG